MKRYTQPLADGAAPPGKPRRAAGFLILVLLAGCAAPAPPPPPEPQPSLPLWTLFDQDGSPADVGAVVAAARNVDVLFMGELHGNPGAHDFQLGLLEGLIHDTREAGRPLALSLEMFERDVQLVLDEYLAGLITEDQFLAAARPWANYQRDYHPLIELAREEGIPVVAANAPRRYVNRVARLGRDALEDLTPEALEWLPPLPYPGPSEAYREEWDRRMEALAHGHGYAHGDDPALMAQALWDAAMAHSIHLTLEALEAAGAAPRGGGGREVRPLVLHLTGSFHVENRTGTPEALGHYRPHVEFRVVTTRTAPDPSDFQTSTEGLEVEGLADFLLLTPSGSGSDGPGSDGR